ncbi:LPXTG cell wall anchor domain-containing protein [Staphylococcus hominis]|uniref:LPXTG cell wall anchor domain-containing protein n=1 Tax=Staphylococcus hominis TaxID=1290 RepID=UPI001F587FF8|nr:LPXTG cell wall anchor domain-containing protein [Staphylococcus hominis]MCI2931441.1 LPXTG cell wall anchor domain-containing protein [Staphylococcus hominis]
MKKSKVLATTTLTGALLFTGVGATHNAHAAEGQLSDAQLENAANNYINSHNIHLNEGTSANLTDPRYYNVPKGYAPIMLSEKENNSPTILYVNKTTGDIIDGNAKYRNAYNNETSQNTVNKADNTTTQDTTNNNTQSTDNTQAATNNETTNNEATNNNTTAATDNNVSTQENTTQSAQTNEAQTTTQALPETGEQSNSGLVTIIASVLLAAGSLLAFRRTSNSK